MSHTNPNPERDEEAYQTLLDVAISGSECVLVARRWIESLPTDYTITDPKVATYFYAADKALQTAREELERLRGQIEIAQTRDFRERQKAGRA